MLDINNQSGINIASRVTHA